MNATLDTPTIPLTPSPRLIESTFTTFDGTQLFYRAWLPATPATRAIILFHRGHEHSARWTDTVEALNLPDTAFFAYDARGHGRSPGDRGWAPDFATLVRDAETFARHITNTHGVNLENTTVIAHSVGAVVAAAWVHDYAPPLRALVLATPAFAVKLYIPLALPALRALQRVSRFRWGRHSCLPLREREGDIPVPPSSPDRWGRHSCLPLREREGDIPVPPSSRKLFVKSYVKAKMLTHDPDQARKYNDDPLISKQIAVNILLDLHDASKRLIADAGAIATPTLILGAGSDWVVKNSALTRFYNRLSSPRKELFIFPGQSHALFHETDRPKVLEKIRSFLNESRDVGRASARDEELSALQSHTHREHHKLSSPQPLYCPKRWSFRLQRLYMKTLGRLSHGIRLGWRTGFDSGPSLDYVYRNRPAGITPIGKLTDYFYLNAIGWRGIRQRRLHLENLLRQTIQRLQSHNQPIQILDIASGPARYLLELLASLSPSPGTPGEGRGEGPFDVQRSMFDVQCSSSLPIQATLRDASPLALDQARQLATTLNLHNISFQQADAFNYDSLASVSPRPNIAIVSGLYELFPDNVLLQQSLAGLAAALQPGGYLLYTNQPWHPQIEMIARVLDNRDHKPWIMRRRTQREMDHLVQEAGFKKQEMLIDNWGIFTVSLAQKRP